jgi:hypothetical protein
MADPTADLDAFLNGLKATQDALQEQFNGHVAKYVEFTTGQQEAFDLLSANVLGQMRTMTETFAKMNSDLLQVAQRISLLEAVSVPSRDNLVPRTFIPGPETTGAYGALTTRVGNLTTTRDGEVFEGLYIEGQVTINHSVTFKRCRIKGGLPTAPGYAVVRCYKALSKPAQMIDCTIEGTPHEWTSCGVQGRDITLIRCNIFNAVDGVMATNSNVKIISPWIHGLYWHPTGHKDGGPTHNDNAQFEGGGGHEVVGGRFDVGSRTNAAIMVTQNVAAITGLLIDSNWFYSMEADKPKQPPVALNMTSSGKGAMTGVEIINNRFSNQNMWRDDRAAWIESATHAVITAADKMRNNTYLNGTPAKLSRG